MKGRVGGAARHGSKHAFRGGRQGDHRFHALRLSISDILQGVVGLAEASGAGVSEAADGGRDMPGLDAVAAGAHDAISSMSNNDPDLFETAYKATINTRGTVEMEGIYAGAVKSLIGAPKTMIRMISCGAATEALFGAFGFDAVGVTRSIRYKESLTRPSVRFVKAYRTAYRDLSTAVKNARGPDRAIYNLADERLGDICAYSVARAAEESWSAMHLCAALTAIFGRIITEDTEESTGDAAGRAADTITKSMGGNPRVMMAETILSDVVPRASYYNSRRRARDAAVREFHRACTDMVLESVGMCVMEELYGAFVAGAYRTAPDRAFFRSNYKRALESACAFDPRTDLAGFVSGERIPSHGTTRWWTNNALRYLVDIDCVAAAKSRENTPLMEFYEYARDIAYTSAAGAVGLRR